MGKRFIFLVVVLFLFSFYAFAADAAPVSQTITAQPADNTTAAQAQTPVVQTTAISTAVQAETPVAQAEQVDLNKIVVTASRLDTLVSDSCNNVSVVDSKTIEESNQSDTADQLLEYLPGVDITRNTGLTSPTSTVTLRGFGAEERGRTLVLIDGIPFNSIYDGEAYWNAINIEDIEKIEVVPGASSALYGAGAMGGVINIITKNPEKAENEFDAGFGTYNTSTYNLDLQNKIGNLSYIVSGGYFTTDGYIVDPTPQPYDIKTNRESFYGNVKGVYDFDKDDSLGVAYRHYNEETNGGYQYYYGAKDTEDVSCSLKKIMDNIDLLGAFYFNWGASPWTYNTDDYYAIDYVDNEYQTKLGGNLQSNIHLAAFDTLTLGVDMDWGESSSEDDYQSMVRTTKYKGDQDNLGIYIQNELKLDEKLILTLGGRWDYWDSYDGYAYDNTASPETINYNEKTSDAFSPKVGLVYHLTEDTAFRASAGESFRAPTLYDLYTTWSYFIPAWYWGQIFEPNPNLKPEKDYSYEVGVDQTLWGRLLGRFTFYDNNVYDLIYPVDTGTYSGLYDVVINQNVGQATIYGVESELRLSITKELSLFGTYTFDYSRIDKYTDSLLDGRYLIYAPRNKSTAGISFENPKLANIEITGRYVDSCFNDDFNTQVVKSYILFDIALSKEINENFIASLKIENIQDRDYRAYYGYVSPGRTVTGNIKVKF